MSRKRVVTPGRASIRSNSPLSASPLSVQVESLAKRCCSAGSLTSVIASEGTVIKRVTCALSMIDVSSSGSLLVALDTMTSGTPWDSDKKISNIESTKPIEVF